jgi:hypothetical protein
MQNFCAHIVSNAYYNRPAFVVEKETNRRSFCTALRYLPIAETQCSLESVLIILHGSHKYHLKLCWLIPFLTED